MKALKQPYFIMNFCGRVSGSLHGGILSSCEVPKLEVLCVEVSWTKTGHHESITELNAFVALHRALA